MFLKQISDDLDRLRQRAGVLPATFALCAVLALAAAPSVSVADTETQDQAEAIAEREEGEAIALGPPPDRFPQLCTINPVLAKLCGSKVVLGQVIESGSGSPDERVHVFRQQNKPWEHKGHDDIKEEDFEAVISTTDPDYVTVQIKLSKQLLREIATDQSDPIRVYGISVLGQLGPNSCIYNCQIINGKRECTCIGS